MDKRYISNGNNTFEAQCYMCKHCTMRPSNYRYRTCSVWHKSVKASADICEKYKMSDFFEKGHYILLRKV